MELTTANSDQDYLVLGASVPITDAMPLLNEHFPELDDLFLRFASPPIRNAGTIGGNVANGSPIGDSLPALLVLGTELVLSRGESRRVLPLDSFYVGYQKNVLTSGEYIEQVRIPLAGQLGVRRSYKVSKRFDQDISAVCGAYAMDIDGEDVSTIRIAYGGLAEVPRRALNAEKALVSGGWNGTSINHAMAALEDDFSPISDMRATAAYRMRIAKNLLYRFWLDVANQNIATDVYGYGR